MVSVLPLSSMKEISIPEEVMYMFPSSFEIVEDPDIPEHARIALVPFVNDKHLFKALKIE